MSAIDYAKLYPVKKFKIAHDGDPVQQAIVAAVTGKKIVVLSYVLTIGGTTDGTVTWQSADTALSGAMSLQSDGAAIIAVDHSPRGCLETVAAEALNITTSGIAVAGHGTYVEAG